MATSGGEHVLDRVTGETTLGEILRIYPGAAVALAVRYHLGMCSCSEYPPEETLASLLDRRFVYDVAQVVEYLKECQAMEAECLVAPRILAERLRHGDGTRLIDIRPEGERAIAVIAGALPLTPELDSELEAWPRDVPIVLVDHRGEDAPPIARRLAQRGFTSVRCLAGGIEGWSLDVDPTVPRYHAPR